MKTIVSVKPVRLGELQLRVSGPADPADLSPFAAEHFAFMNPDFSTTRGPDWLTDAFHDSPGPKTLLTLPGAEHSLGGVVGAGAAETTDENPERVALIQRVTVDYLTGAPTPGVSK